MCHCPLWALYVSEGCAWGDAPWGLTGVLYYHSSPLNSGPGPGPAAGELTLATLAVEVEPLVSRDPAPSSDSPGRG